MKYAQIRDGKVCNVVELPEDASDELLAKFAEGFDALKLADEAAGVGDAFDPETEAFARPEAEAEEAPKRGQVVLEGGVALIAYPKASSGMFVALGAIDEASGAGFATKVVEGESFYILSSNPNDARTVNWIIL